MNRHSNCLQQNIDACPQRSMSQLRNAGAERGNVAIIETLFSCCQALVAGGWRYVNSIRVPHINYPPVLTALVKFDRKLIKIWQNMSHRSYLQTMESVMQSGIRRLDPGPGTAQVKHVSRRQKQSNKTVLGLFLFSSILQSSAFLPS